MTTVLESSEAAGPQGQTADTTTHVVILLHGIRTRAFWYDKVRPILDSVNHVEVRPLGYGYFNILRFLFPFGRRGPQRTIVEKIRNIKGEFERERQQFRLSVIAHSFGTYTIASILEKENDIDLHNLILCGSVLPIDFDFGKIARKVHNFRINDVGVRDIWPVLAKICSFGYGESGTYGFLDGLCEDRFHDFRHSDFFGTDFIKRYWYPIFADDRIPQSPFVRTVKTAPKLLSGLSILPRGFIPSFIACLSALWIALFMLFGANETKLCNFWNSLPFCSRPIPDCARSTDFAKCWDALRGANAL